MCSLLRRLKRLEWCCVLTSISQSTYRASSFLVEMTSKHPHTLTASISLYQLLFGHQHVFPSIVLHVLNRRPEAISASLSCAGFLPSRCIGAALNLPSVNDWSGSKVKVYEGIGQCCDGACFFTLYEHFLNGT